MKAYLFVEIQVHDPEQYQVYRQLTPATLAPYGGRFVVRGGPVETVEGDWTPERIVILEFPDAEMAKAWWNSTEYAAARELRQRSAHTQMLLLREYVME